MRYILDIECYVNYFLIMFVPEDGVPLAYEVFNDKVAIDELAGVDWGAEFVTFNGNKYDMLMLSAGTSGKFTNTQLKYINDRIIRDKELPWNIEREFNLTLPVLNHVDIREVLPLTGSLKIYGGRLASRKLQDLPIDPYAIVRGEDRELLRKYCVNDCVVTGELRDEIAPQIDLRAKMGEKYGQDLRSKSDAQIAETVIASEFEKLTGCKLSKPGITSLEYKYTPPDFINFDGDIFNDMLEEIKADVFKIKPTNGQVIEPVSLRRKIEFGNDQYKLGLGGLHSVDKPGSFYSDEDTVLYDIDVASYYPRIILNAGYYPAHIGPTFLGIYRNIVETRLAAKESGDEVTNAALKIVINGTFGKFGSKYSKLYSPDLMFHTTVTGQLCLLMLIEKLGDLVISANTDGVTVRVSRDRLKDVKATVREWEDHTGFDMEWTKYRSLHRRDVNNYFAITAAGKVKAKGVFAEPGLSKNPANRVIYEAVIDHYKNGTSVESFIHGCKDVRKFLSLRTVNGGAKWGDELLGKSVRWYHSAISDKCIEYQTNGNKVPLTDNSVVLQDLPGYLPWDVDRSWYIDEAKKLIEVMG